MAELLGCFAAASQLIGTCFSLIQMIESIKGRKDSLDSWKSQLEELRSLSTDIIDNPFLQTTAIGTCADSLLRLVEKIKLEPLVRGSRLGRSLLFLYQEKRISEAFVFIDRKKTTLLLIMWNERARTVFPQTGSRPTSILPMSEGGVQYDIDAASSNFSDSASTLVTSSSSAQSYNLALTRTGKASYAGSVGYDTPDAQGSEQPESSSTSSTKFKDIMNMVRDAREIDPDASFYHGNTAEAGQEMQNGNRVTVEGPLDDPQPESKASSPVLGSAVYVDCKTQGGGSQVNGNSVEAPSNQGLNAIGGFKKCIYVNCNAYAGDDRNSQLSDRDVQKRQQNGHVLKISGRNSGK